MGTDPEAGTPPPPVFEGYDQIELLGRGGMATVWRARQIALDRPVAVKVLNPDQCRSDEDIDRFQSEARAAARMSHPGIVQVYDAFYRDGRFCFVMEFVDGRTVGDWIRRSGFLSEKDALFVAEGVASTLRYAWERQQLVHCDIKPDNVMIDADGTVKVMDFGLSRSLCSLQARRAAEGDADDEYVFGTPAYMAPEQATGAPDLSVQADMYALGALLYHACTGRRLFHDVPTEEVMSAQVNDQDESPLERNGTLSAPFCDLIERLLAKDPADRFADWGAAVAAISRVRAGRPFAEGPLDPEEQPSTVRHCPEVDRLRALHRPSVPKDRDEEDHRTARAVRAAIRVGSGLGDRLSDRAARRRRRLSASPFIALLVFSAMLFAAAVVHSGWRRICYEKELQEELADLRALPLDDLADYAGLIARIDERLGQFEQYRLNGASFDKIRAGLSEVRHDLSLARTARVEATLGFLEQSVSFPGPDRGLRFFQGPWDRRGHVRRGAFGAAQSLRWYTGPFAAETGIGRTNSASRFYESGKAR